MHAHMVDYESQADVARRFRISVGLVGRICSSLKKDNNILQKLEEEESNKNDIREKVQCIAEEMLQKNKPIWKAQLI